MIELPAGVRAMSGRGPQWARWVATLPAVAQRLTGHWRLRPDSTEPAGCGHCSLVLPVRTADGLPAMLKIGFPDAESEYEHLALRRWAGRGAVRLLNADPHHRALLLERLSSEDLSAIPESEACAVVAGLYRTLHLPASPALRQLSVLVDRWTAELADLPRSAPIPRRLVEQAVALGRELSADRSVPDRMIHTDLHYANVLATSRQCGPSTTQGRRSDPVDREPWLAIDPKPVNGDPHYELAPMLWNRWPEITGDIRGGVRRRFQMLLDATGFDEDRARAWVVVRMVHNAMWAVADGPEAGPGWLTRCIAVAKAVQD